VAGCAVEGERTVLGLPVLYAGRTRSLFFIYLTKSGGEITRFRRLLLRRGAAGFQRLASLAAYSELGVVFSHPGQGFDDLW
jgi:hypothetical protein